MKRRRLLVTGSTGLLGFAVVHEAMERLWEVIAVTHHFPLSMKGVTSVAFDLSDDVLVSEMLAQFRPDVVINCAAATDIDWCESNLEAAARMNAILPEVLSRESIKNGIRLVHISTDAVFDGSESMKKEDSRTNPLNTYGRTKLHGENSVLNSCSQALVFRTNIFGWNLQPKLSLGEWILHKSRTGEEIIGFQDVCFSPLLANTAATVMFDAIEKQLRGLYHLCSVSPVTKYDFCMSIAREFGFAGGNIRRGRTLDVPLSAPRALDLSMLSGKLERDLGYGMPSVGEQISRFNTIRDSSFMRRLNAARLEKYASL